MNKSKSATSDPDKFEGRLLISPAEDRRVRKPDGSPLPDDGEVVNVDTERSYWLRRLGDGDILVAPAPAEDGETA